MIVGYSVCVMFHFFQQHLQCTSLSPCLLNLLPWYFVVAIEYGILVMVLVLDALL